MFDLLRKYFFSGLFTLLPVLITVWLIWFLFTFVDTFLGSLFDTFLGFYFPGMGLIIIVIVAIAIGYLTTYIFGRRLLKIGGKILSKLPIINMIYSSIKQINDLLFLQKETRSFRRVCAVEYPRKGIFSIGFVTGEGLEELNEKRHIKHINVFIPNTPTPATGFMISVPEDEIMMLDIKLEDAIKLIVSGGVLTPPPKAK